MSHLGTIEESNFVPAVDAARRFGYTKDYLLLLAKQGKIRGEKNGHKWFIDLESTEKFFRVAEEEKNERRKRLSAERKSELKSSVAIRPVIKESPQNTVFTELAATLLIGLTIGVAGYLGTVGVGMEKQVATVSEGVEEVGFFEKLARSLYGLFVTEDKVVVLDENTQTEATEETLVTDGGLEISATKEEALIVIPGGSLDDSDMEKIRASFSDEVQVEVDPLNPDNGTVTPRFKNREGEAYRFLMVPVTEEQTSS